jgi:carboxypeptidase family protein
MRYPLAGLAVWLLTCALPDLALAQDVAAVRIRVTDGFSGDALSGARVAFPDLGLSAETDRTGIASFDVPVGEHALQVTRLGFARGSQVVSVKPGALVEAQIALTLQPLEVEGVYVNAQRQWSTTLQANGFVERAKLGFGKQLDRTAVRRGNLFRLDRAIENLIPRHCSQETRASPLRGQMGTVKSPGDPDYVPPPGGRQAPRPGSGSATQPIPTQTMGMGVAPIVFLDGVRYPFDDLKDVPIDWVEGVEVYSGFAGLPAKYSSLAPCGAILIWTG